MRPHLLVAVDRGGDDSGDHRLAVPLPPMVRVDDDADVAERRVAKCRRGHQFAVTEQASAAVGPERG